MVKVLLPIVLVLLLPEGNETIVMAGGIITRVYRLSKTVIKMEQRQWGMAVIVRRDGGWQQIFVK